MNKTNIVVCDIETTASSPRSASVASIGAVDFDNPSNTFYIENRIEKNAYIKPEALAVNGFTVKELTDKSKVNISTALSMFSQWCRDHNLTAFSSWSMFDISFLSIKFSVYNVPWGFGHRFMDIKSVVIANLISKNIDFPNTSLDTCLEFLGVPKRKTTHNALIDARLETEVFYRTLFGKPFLQDFSEYPVPDLFKK